ncbi:hypothetical protein RchiOBHm_Chr7g0191271 [Rosa chinensis]|uniref:Uncharacterized protein n=1 Tax=Rosa chinensis TaxID=74649 RepID=A0A2P6P590_ROSCH|nr:hypothetical protein RchiOBHm_Chr7g0191271 [Rosa chinensis]
MGKFYVIDTFLVYSSTQSFIYKSKISNEEQRLNSILIASLNLFYGTKK